MTSTTRLDLTPTTPLDTRELVEAAFELRRSGDAARALCAARIAYGREPYNAQVQTALAWGVEASLKREVGSGRPSNRVVEACAHEYAKLEKVDRPGLVHSMMLARLSHVAERWPGFLGFVRRFGNDQFRAEDYTRMPKREGDGSFPSRAEGVARGVYKSLGPSAPADAVEWAVGFFAAILKRQPDAEWIPYYQGKLLILLGRVEEARTLVLPVLRRHDRSFWAWEMLAEICQFAEDAGGESPGSRRLACLAKALAVGEKPEYLVKVRRAFAEELVHAGRLEEARAELEEIRRVRRGQGWKEDPEVERRLAGADLGAIVPRRMAEADLDALAASAADALFDDLPWLDGVVVRRFKEGDGIVVALSEGVTVPAHDRALAASAEPGDPVRLRVWRDGAEGKPRVRDARPGGDGAEPVRFRRDFKGTASRKDGSPFAFVDAAGESIFVSPDLVDAEGIRDGDPVSGVALRLVHPKTGRPAWRAVRVATSAAKRAANPAATETSATATTTGCA